MLGRRSICIDPKNGIFLVRKISKGIDTPIHVQKKTTSNGISRCEADECIDCVEAVSRGQHPGFECVHLRAIQFAEPFVPQTPLDDNVLDKMVDKYKWLSESRQRECFALRNKADRPRKELVWFTHGFQHQIYLNDFFISLCSLIQQHHTTGVG